jgi:hypothetical protein
MSIADDTRAVLLVIRLRGAADPATVVTALASMGFLVEDPAVLLGRLELAGLLERRAAAVDRWRLTDEGRQEGERLLAVELDGAAARQRVTDAYTAFLALNGPLLRVCTDWQLRDADPASIVVNDHTDAAFDRAVLNRLRSIHRSVLPICDELTACLDRFRSYRTRLTAAHDRVVAGDGAALDQPSTDSFHAIWFELHEDLVATLGRDRSTEPLPDTSAGPPR